MSFYRILLAALASAVIAAPAFADDDMMPVSDYSNVEQQQTTTASDTGMAEQTKININRASAKELMKVKGINAEKARAIIAYRKKHGDFKSTDDLANIAALKKLKPAKLRAIETQITVD